MKNNLKIIPFIIAVLFGTFQLTAQCTTLTNAINPAANWILTNTNSGGAVSTITNLAGTNITGTNVLDNSRDVRLSRTLGTVLPNAGGYNVQFVFRPTLRSAFGPSAYPIMLANTSTIDPMNGSAMPNVAPDNAATRFIAVNFNSLANNAANILSVTTRNGAFSTIVTTDVPGFNPVLNVSYFITLERLTATNLRLLVHSDAARLNLQASVCVTIPATLNNLNVISSGNNSGGGSGRLTSYNVSNLNVNCLSSIQPTISASATSVCIGSTVTLTGSSNILGSTYSWYNVPTGGTALGTSSTFTPTITATTTYYVQVTSACYVSNRIPITITANPSPVVAAITGNASVCKNQIIELMCATPGGVWASQNTAIATIHQNGVATGVSAGTVNITYTVTNASGCTTTVTKSITVNDVVTFSIVGEDNIITAAPFVVCPNTCRVFHVTPSVAGADYTWNIQDATNVGVYFNVSGSTSTTVCIPSSVATNPFTLRCQGLNSCGASQIVTKLIQITSDVPPVPTVTCSGTSGSNSCVNLDAAVVAGYTPLWSWYNPSYASATTQSIVRPLASSSSTAITVGCTYTSAFGCKKTTYYTPICTYAGQYPTAPNTTISSQNSSMKRASIGNGTEVTVFPNPNNGNFTIEINGYVGKATVINVLGEVMEEIMIDENSNRYDIKMSDKPTGVYLLRLNEDKDGQAIPFVVQ